MFPVRNNLLYLAPQVLMYGDLLNCSISDIKLSIVFDKAYYQLYFDIFDKSSLYTFRKMKKLEPNYYCSRHTDKGYCMEFSVPRIYFNQAIYLNTMPASTLLGERYLQLYDLLNKKAPVVKTAEASFVKIH